MSFSQNLITNIYNGKFISQLNKPEEIEGDFVPAVSSLYNIGSNVKRWNDLFVDEIIGNVKILNIPNLTSGNILYYGVGGNLSFGPAPTGSITDPLTIGNVRCNNLKVNNISGNLVSNVSLLGNIFLGNIRNFTTGNILYYNNVSREIGFGVLSGTTLESGINFVNTTASLMATIPTTVTKIPITNTTAPTTTWSTNWARDWTTDTTTPNNSRLIYNGASSKRFIVRVNMNLTSAGVGANVFTALYINGSLSGNNISGQFVSGTFGAWNYTSEFYITLVSTQYIEIFTYASSTGINLTTTTNNFGGGTNVIPAIVIQIEEVFIP